MTIISHLKLMVPVIDEPPPELMDEFIKGCIRAAPKTYRHLKQALPDTKAVIAKMIKPGMKGKEPFFRPDYVTRRGLEMKDILTVSEAEIETWARRWLKKTHLAFQDNAKEFIQKIKFKAVYYLKEIARLNLPFSGFGDKIRGVGPVGARWLTGDQSVLSLIGPQEIIMAPPVDITRSGPAEGEARPKGRQAPGFRGRFIRQILASGGQIVKTSYLPDQIEKGNDKINRLVRRYAADRFVPFTPGGASHVDFISEPGHLYLDIQVSVFE